MPHRLPQDGIDDPEAVQDLQRATLQPVRVARRRPPGLLVDDPRLHLKLRRPAGCHQPGRAGADYQQIGVSFVSHCCIMVVVVLPMSLWPSSWGFYAPLALVCALHHRSSVTVAFERIPGLNSIFPGAGRCYPYHMSTSLHHRPIRNTCPLFCVYEVWLSCSG